MAEQLFLWQTGAKRDRGGGCHLGDVSEMLMPGHVEEIRTGKQLEKSLTASMASGYCLPPPSL